MIPSVLRRAARLYRDEPAIRWADEERSYAEVSERVRRLASRLSQDLSPGDRVALLAPNGPLAFEVYFAAAWAGLILVPLNTRLPAPAISGVLEHAGVKRWIVHERFEAIARDVAAARGDSLDTWVAAGAAFERDLEAATPIDAHSGRPDDPVQLYYTSGTTDDPKGVILTHRNVCSHALMATVELGLRDSDVFGHIAPMFHLADAWATFAVTWAGGCHRFSAEFEPEAVLDLLASDVTLTNLVPTMLGDLVNHPSCDRSYPKLRTILSGGAPIAPTLVARLIEVFACPYVQTYGLTETSPFLTMSTLPTRLASLPESEQLSRRCKTGRPLTGVELQVVDPEGRPVAADGEAVGEIVVRGDSVTPGYWRNPEATAAAFQRGWFHTGDLATWDAEGFVDIVDRKKDVVLSGGETVYSTEVEHVLATHEAVREVAVFGVPHPRWGEAVVAAVVLREGATVDEQELRDHGSRLLGGHQLPQRVLFRDALPHTGSGKIAKRTLREETAGLFAG